MIYLSIHDLSIYQSTGATDMRTVFILSPGPDWVDDGSRAWPLLGKDCCRSWESRPRGAATSGGTAGEVLQERRASS